MKPTEVWSSRGYLPHFDDGRTTQHVTIHLADSLPAYVISNFEYELRHVPPEKFSLEKRKRIEAWVDAGHGSCILRDARVAEMIQDTLLHFDGERYRLLAWVVMPNHFHVVLDQMNGWTVCKIVASWKKFTASQIRKIHPGFPKPVWHREYWDRYIRDGEHLGNSIRYDEENPVKAGLCSKATEWQWSSARKRG